MIRLFVAIDLPESLKTELLNLRMGIPQAQWTPLEKLHLTLRFIGEVIEPEFLEIAKGLGKVQLPAFPLTLTGVGAFHSRKLPRVLWVGVQKSEELKQLHGRIESCLREFGVPPEERKFSPHITLARFSSERGGGGENAFYRIGDFLKEFNLYRSEPFMVSAFHLYSGLLTSKQAHYRQEYTYPLCER
ncbi:MAG: RNA 2',3'-cyclic phosphodiesterase [Oligoflexia bacterium]|nr:RNA 2',3'-cyclic phosphodiesterase [Oligoflexia bacterium]MBF0366885.1 RNA 2',3'-cyclic phosphodiesterase [Oligoflexia bacterium]